MITIIIWIITAIFARILMKQTVVKYGFKTHNKIKSLMVVTILLVLGIGNMSINVSWQCILLIILNFLLVGSSNSIRNKLLEDNPTYITNSTTILMFAETFVIDMLLGVIDIEIMIVVSMLLKVIGVWCCTKGKSENKNRSMQLYRGIVITSLLMTTRMYVSSALMNQGHISKDVLAIASQLSIGLYTYIRFRNHKMKITKELVIDYIPQVVLSSINDLLYYTLVAKGVNSTVDVELVLLIIMMVIEEKRQVKGLKVFGIGLILLSWLL